MGGLCDVQTPYQRHQQAQLESLRTNKFRRYMEDSQVVEGKISDACGYSCIVDMEEVQARLRRVRCFPLPEETCIPNIASSDPFGREEGESRSLSLAAARHPRCAKALTSNKVLGCRGLVGVLNNRRVITLRNVTVQ
jgi:hypothetical protein